MTWPGPDARVEVAPGTAGANQPTRVEILLSPTITISPASVMAWAAATALPPTRINTGSALNLPGVDVTITGLTAVPSANRLHVTVAATIIATQANALQIPTVQTPVGLSVALIAEPESSPLAPQSARVSIDTAAPITIIGSPFTGLAEMMAPYFIDLVSAQVTAALTGWLSTQLPQLIAATFAIAALPANCRLSLRRLNVSDGGIAIEPVLACTDTSLSTYAPTNIVPDN